MKRKFEEEDLSLKQQLELYLVTILQDSEPELKMIALEGLKQEIRTSTRSMTSIPKPIKFLRSHYETLKSYRETLTDSDDDLLVKKNLADVLSVLASTMSDEEEKGSSLMYRLLDSDFEDIDSWGHQYVRNLSREITQECAKWRENEQDSTVNSDADLMLLVQWIVASHMKHNAEPEAVDLLIELGKIHMILEQVDSGNFERTCLYLTSASRYLPGADDVVLVLETVFMIYLRFEKYASALRIALFLDNMVRVKQIFTSCDDVIRKRQFGYMLARHGVAFEVDEDVAADDAEREVLQNIINNNRLSEGYLSLARDLEVIEPKSPEDIYKSHLSLHGRGGAGAGGSVDSACQNLAATFVNAFVNSGFGQDKLMTARADPGSSANHSLFKNKGHGKASAAASLGMISLWDVDSGLAQLDKFIHSNDNHVTAGALLGAGIAKCGIKNVWDPAVLALLFEYIGNADPSIQVGGIMGLGLAYAGTQDEQIRDKLCHLLGDAKIPLDVIAFTAISLGLVYVGSCNVEIAQAIIFAVMIRSESELEEPLTKFLPLGLGLLYLGKQDSVEALAEVSKMTFNEKISKYCDMTLLSCAYVGSGNVLKFQSLLGHCAQNVESGEMAHQGSAVLGISMVAMSEELGVEMAIRSLEHLSQYENQPRTRRAVPLALGLLCISNPKVNVIETLRSLSHDTDSEVAMAAVFSLGLMGAGTNNAQISVMLRNLSTYYHQDSSILFCVRIAQGLVHLGKGLLTLNPYHSDRFLLSPKALAGLVIVLHACLDVKTLILGNYHYILYFLVLAMQPRMLMTLDENLKPISVPVRVGQAVDVVAQAGRPRTVTGFKTHSTPVLLADGERAELATDKYLPLSPILEGFVILKQNPDYNAE